VYLLTRKVNEARCENRDVEYRTEQNNIHRYTDAAAPIHMQSNAKWQTFRRANKRTLSPMLTHTHTHTHTQDSAFVFGLAFAFGSLNEKLNVDVCGGWCGRFGRRSLKGQFKEANEKHSARSVRAATSPPGSVSLAFKAIKKSHTKYPPLHRKVELNVATK